MPQNILIIIFLFIDGGSSASVVDVVVGCSGGGGSSNDSISTLSCGTVCFLHHGTHIWIVTYNLNFCTWTYVIRKFLVL